MTQEHNIVCHVLCISMEIQNQPFILFPLFIFVVKIDAAALIEEDAWNLIFYLSLFVVRVNKVSDPPLIWITHEIIQVASCLGRWVH